VHGELRESRVGMGTRVCLCLSSSWTNFPALGDELPVIPPGFLRLDYSWVYRRPFYVNEFYNLNWLLYKNLFHKTF
jgi:hypothetical protein